MSAAVVAERLGRIFDGKPPVEALRDVSLRVGGGQITALVGPDGAGKSTLLRMIAGLIKPGSGKLQVLGMDVAARPQAVQDRISYMPQRFGLYEDLTVQENLDLYADLHGVPSAARRERFAQLLHMTDLRRFTGRPAGKLSGGMKQKLGLACTLVRSPELLLLDEPTVGVDPLSRRELWEILHQLVGQERLGVLVSTTYMDEAQRCAHVIVLSGGKVLAAGPPDALHEPAQGLCHVATPPDGVPARLLQARLIDDPANIIDAVPEGGEVRYIRSRHADDGAITRLLAGAPTRDVPARLEDGVLVLLHAHGAEAGAQSSVQPGGDPRAPSAPAAQIVIRVRDVVRKFGDFVAVAQTSFDVRRGEIFGLLGPNGAGKTTTFRMLCGLLPASSGHIEVAGMDLRRAAARARRKVGYMSQKFALYGNLTVDENLSFFGGAYGLSGRTLVARIDAVLAQFDLGRHRQARAADLPGGYKQRLAMAAAQLHEPEILFLDEPTSGIDPLARRAFWRHITMVAQTGTTIIVTTHFMEEAEYCDRILIQDAGRMLAMGTPDEVRREAGIEGGDMTAAFIAIVEKARTPAQKQEAA